ncbi:uncharacterized protein PAC_16386 [Phialocephala subalpina]|uniref:Uncharacterized protein n=1 Tax=Phialocephala subalpina TaxID=576137 RepID=A0A1L7XN63_9HELO|nr:uncharacterized protein PAC_16386 [Phialocephala subalpina]
MQLFAINEDAHFAAGLTASVARSAIKRKEAARKTEEISAGKGKGRAVDDDDNIDIVPIGGLEDVVAARPELEPWEPDSQTIIVDCITDVDDSI